MAETAFAASPNITGFNPTFGGPGTPVTIFGSGFTGASAVQIGNNSGSAIIDVQASTDTQLFITVQSNATTSTISVTIPAGTMSSAGTFTVAPRVTGFAPASESVGRQIRVDGENFYVVGGQTGVRFGSRPAVFADYVSSAQQLFVTVPADSETGPITVIVAFSGNQLSGSSSTNFIVTGTGPVITGFSPTSDLPGRPVRIDGGDFIGTSSVTFNGTDAPGFYVSAPTQIHVNVPDTATTGPIRVTTPAGTATSSSNFVVSGAPLISDFSPAGGPVGTPVVINGSRFTGTTNVTFNGTNAPGFSITADTQIHVNVPTDATTGPISISNPFGTVTSATSFVVGSAPGIDDFSPKGGPVGTLVTINGANFQNITNVNFNGTNATEVTVTSTTQLSVRVPADATTGPITISTLTGSATTTNSFIVGAAPSITNFSPYFGNLGDPVLIEGENFLAGQTTVLFNGATNADAVVTSATQISAHVPANATTGPITVFTVIGTNTTSSNFFVTPRIDGFFPTNGVAGATITVGGMNFIGATSVKFNGVDAVFTVNTTSNLFATLPVAATTGPVSVSTPAGIVTTSTNFHVGPTITGLTPDIGPVGTVVTIAGSGFSGVSGVFFNGVSDPTFAVDSATQIRATVPPAATSGPVVAATSDGNAVSPTSFRVIPAITSFTPGQGGFGTTVTINGTSLNLVTAVRFNGVNAPFTPGSASQMTATVPAGATTGPIQLVSPDGTVASTNSFVVSTSITSFTPTSGTVDTVVTINGSGLTNLVDVQFNGVAAVFEAVSESQLRATVPTNATTGFIRVNTAQGIAFSASSFHVLPRIDSFTPASGEYNTTVIIDGSGFDEATSVQFNGTNAGFSVVSPSRITANVPLTAITGPITVSTPFGSMTTPTNFHVLARITSFSPGAAAEQKGVNIYGWGFWGTTNVTFNGTNATGLLLSPTNIFVTVPAGARNGPITVATLENTAVSSASFVVLPAITLFSPTNGVTGTSVTINGTSFYDVSAVRFNGVSATYVTNTTTQVTATVPETATTGPITLTTPDGTATSGGVFTVDPVRLGIRPAAVNLVVITWPGVSTNYSLEATLSLSPTISWTAVTNTPALVNGQNTVTNSLTSSNRFYRLRK